MSDATQSPLISGGELYLYGTVVAYAWPDYPEFDASMVVDALAQMEGDITVRLNSGGGDAFTGKAIYTLLKAHKGKVTIKVDAIAASAASVIAMAGDRIEMGTGALMMIHDGSAFTIGTDEDHARTAALLTKNDQSVADIYAERTGQSVEAARALMDAETWMDAEEAIAAGFADAKDGDAAVTASAFDYRLYQRAPAPLIAASVPLHNLRGGMDRRASPAGAAGTPAGPPVTAPQEASMSVEQKGAATTTAPDNTPQATVDVTAIEQTAPQVPDREAITKVERQRARDITQAVRAAKLEQSVADDLIEKGVSVDVARAAIIDMLADRDDQSSGGEIVNARASITEDGLDRFKTGVTLALMAKGGLKGGERNEFSGLTLREMARESLQMRGLKPSAASGMKIIEMAFVPTMAGGMHTTSDFGNILANVAEKAMMMGHEEAEETFQIWTTPGTLTDFKEVSRVDMTAFPSLATVDEHGEYKNVTVGDYKEAMQLATYGAMFSISRQAIINDDLGAFTRVPRKMGRAAIRTVGNLVYAILTGNPTMGDGTELFHADHGNLASSGAAPSVASLTAARKAMRTQKDRAANATALNIVPTYGLVPAALEGTMLQVLGSEHDPSKTSRAMNTVRNMVTPIVDARLDAASATAWYLAANPNAIDTIEVAYLDGVQTPTLEQQDGWRIDGTEFKVRIDAVAKALAWEGLYKDPGAS